MKRFLKLKTTWSNTELGILKICLVSLGICIGLFFYESLGHLAGAFFAAYLVTGIWLMLLWIKRMK